MNKNIKEFKALQAEWDQKLADSGFKDIEQRDSDGKLKSWATLFHRRAPEQQKATEEYYRAAGQFLYNYQWQNAVDRRIWELHSQGMARFKILDILRAENLWYLTDSRGLPRRKDARPNSFGVQKSILGHRAIMIRKIEDERRENNTEE